MLLSTAAAILLIALLSYPASNPRPTADPHLFVMVGNPRVEVTQANPGPRPVAIPRDQWPMETLVETTEKPSSVRWNSDYILEIKSNTSLMLHSGQNRFEETDRPSLRLDRGGLIVKLAVVSAPIDIIVGSSRVRVAQPTVFTLSDLGPQSDGPSVKISVESGSVEATVANATMRRVGEGESMLLP